MSGGQTQALILNCRPPQSAARIAELFEAGETPAGRGPETAEANCACVPHLT
jgi:hypothetical protein